MSESFYWHDYETWGVNPRLDRPAQFAGVRTDADLNIVGEPLMLYCHPPNDMLPRPEAVAVTGITPQEVQEKGLDEREFFRQINAELSVPGTCALGYNTLAFDDEVTRFGLWRNFMDPYAREWRNGNSRWDLIDLGRLVHAVSPGGIEWPQHEDGRVSFRLEDLASANELLQEKAHDALSDVYATIALARLLKQRKPGLFDSVFRRRRKADAAELLYSEPVILEVGRHIPSQLGCLSPIVPLTVQEPKLSVVLAVDLRHDPALFLDQPPEAIKARLFSSEDELQGLRKINLGRAPVLLPYSKLPAAAADRWSLDPEEIARRRAWVESHRAELLAVAEHVFDYDDSEPLPPEAALYDGFPPKSDQPWIQMLSRTDSPEEAERAHRALRDPRLQQLALNLRARRWPESLAADERTAWEARTRRRLCEGVEGATVSHAQFLEALASTREARPERLAELAALEDWVTALLGRHALADRA